ncbi:WD40-repeat-containing domain protein [Hygrophoropsis aurantiaca]|uniref:WD40-repeat-containing domain protein n=1 Tax=Hygrophoropsis aurantiaca TaxID=72124 RepID=A0ACB7ZRM8_9AGAM|nr:WD40-repeat-containing domain protein [Hygrophoropsis aurantiaca]
MSLRYKSRGILRGEHQRTITCLAFSPDGAYVASGSLDGKLSIWCTNTGKLLYVIGGTVGILALCWNSPSRDNVLCGLENGMVVSVNIDHDLSATGYVAHRLPVERLAILGTYVATGAHNEVCLWWNANNEHWYCIASSNRPPYVGMNMDHEAIVTSLHWRPSSGSESATLVASYLHHGIVFFETPSFKIVRFIATRTLVGDTSLSPDYRHLVVSNLCTGFDVYDLEVSAPIMTLTHDVKRRLPVPVLFIHRGNAILGGSTSGKASLWTSAGKHLHTFPHEENAIILAIAAHYNRVKDRFVVATGAQAEVGGAPYLQLWEAFDLCECRFLFPRRAILTYVIDKKEMYFRPSLKPVAEVPPVPPASQVCGVTLLFVSSF